MPKTIEPVIKEAVKPAYFLSLPLGPILEADTPGHSSIILSFIPTQKPTHSRTFLLLQRVLLDIEAKDWPFLASPLPSLDWENGKVT